MAAWEVTRLLTDLLVELAPRFTRAAAATWLRAQGGDFRYYVDTTEKVEALLHALGKCPGVEAVPGEARYVCDLVAARSYAPHRTWRMALPHADVADATVLARILSQHSGQLTPRLKSLAVRLAEGLAAL
tara:strand:+ start:4529 stop:4918 length:390 start_codon:yes stop_codon:yes gene_type:complete